jgi:uncharacterized membrane protein HdeD (DUF308 family)
MNALANNWWLLVLRGGLAGLFGLSILAWPNLTLGALVALFGTYAILDGLCAIVSALRAASRPGEGWPVTSEGLVSLVFGILAFVWPWVPRNVVHVIASWGVLTGLLELVGAARLPRKRASHWFLGLGGISSLFLAGLLFAVPHANQHYVMWIIAGYALVFGALLCLTGLRLRAVTPANLPSASEHAFAKLPTRS